MTRSIIAALALAPPLAAAQPAPAASAASAQKVYTKADITKGTACGAPGIGEVWAGPRKGDIEPREGKPGYRVNENGYWAVGCKMPPRPKDCPARKVEPWTIDGHTCVTVRTLPERNVPASQIVRGDLAMGTWGFQQWRCRRNEDGTRGWVMTSQICAGR